jgi:quercetin dioxygenase-like cupin family protein
MEIHEALAQFRKEKKLKITELHQRIKKAFGPKTITYRTLLRVLMGHTAAREVSLYQICVGLKITIDQLRARAGKPQGTRYLKRSLRRDHYIHNAKAQADILTKLGQKIMSMELTLAPRGETKVEQAPDKRRIIEKWVYTVRGKLVCFVDNRAFTLKKGDCLSFDANRPHYFKNKTSKKTQCLIVQTT